MQISTWKLSRPLFNTLLTGLVLVGALSQATPSLAADAAFDGATGVLTLPVVDVPGTGVVNAGLRLSKDNPIEFTLQSAQIYTTPVTLNDKSARVRDGGVLYIPSVQVGSQLYELNMTLIKPDPITFGNLQVLGITNVTPPAPDPLQLSITAGQNRYAQLCASCHGSNGDGDLQGPSLVTSGFNTFSTLRVKINNTMPLGNSSACVDNSNSTCATDIANFIFNRLQR
ncbi:MAG: cytochrome c [Pseudomonadota bacterium]